MKKMMNKKFGRIGIATIGSFLPMVAFAQEEAVGADHFVNSLPLWIAVAVGLVASFMVLGHAKKMKGGIFGTVLNYFGWGMLFVVLGFLAVVVPPWASMGVIMRTHDVAFIIGYILMVMGAQKLHQATRS